jgi:hypothetical protein
MSSPSLQLHAVTVVIDDYDTAIAHYVDVRYGNLWDLIEPAGVYGGR